MKLSLLFLTLSLLKICSSEVYPFPSNFLFGAATASYQIEGAWNVDGKLESIWDTATHRRPNGVADGTTGDDVANSYYFYEKDVEILRDVGFKTYRFSIAWTRVLDRNLQPNQKGLDYYDRLINALLREGIAPMVTMYHWDLPQWIQDLGGWTNPKTIDFFVHYADLLYKTYGDRVRMWITFNEPSIFCGLGYGWAEHAPHIRTVGNMGFYLCGHHVLLAHAKTYHLYKEKYFASQQGEVGINTNAGYAFKMWANVTDDVIDRAMQFNLGHWGHPLFIGDYAPVMKEFIARKSSEEGRRWSRLPTFTPEEVELIKGTNDFLALNYYSSSMVAPLSAFPGANSAASDNEIMGMPHPDWERAKSTWLYSTAEGLHDLLVWIKDNYNNVKVYVTENGWSDEPGTIHDDGRVRYLNNHLSAISRAINVEGCNIRAYTVWSLVDNFEWMMGLTERFGIFAVDFDDPAKPRVPKDSVQIFRDLTQNYWIDTNWTYVKPSYLN